MSDAPLSSVPPWLTIIGIGEDGRAGLSPAAAAALDAAEVVYGGARHFALGAPLRAETRVWLRPISDAYPGLLARRGRPTCILATGDPFHFGIGAEIARLLPAAEMCVFPHPSAFSLAAARLGWPLAETTCITLHGRALERIVPHLQPGAPPPHPDLGRDDAGGRRHPAHGARFRRLSPRRSRGHGRPA